MQELLDGVIHGNPRVNWQEKLEIVWSQQVLLGISLQNTNRIRKITLPRETIVDLDQTYSFFVHYTFTLLELIVAQSSLQSRSSLERRLLGSRIIRANKRMKLYEKNDN